ncbi:MAG: cell division protein SepF [Lachnospiraceae bacterium]|nr:cell division protein SepF [Candidatus Colinaster equi]
MSFMDNILDGLKFNSDDEYEDDYYDEEDNVEASRSNGKSEAAAEERKIPFTPKAATTKTKHIGNGMEVCVIKPTSENDTKEITDTLLSNRTVVLNMEGLDKATAQRIIDFTSGSTYAIHGNLQMISNHIFLITPASVDISGDFQTILNDSFDVPQF